MEMYLGTHEPTWLGRSPVPLFVSLARASRFGRRPAPVGWALDSGGFTQIAKGGWKMSPREYLDAAYNLADRSPGMRWAAPQDWMCEPAALSATGLDVDGHQRRTVENFCQLRQLDERNVVIPVLQGWAPGEHERCVEMYAEAGVDLTAEPLVGVGTVCRRQASDEIEDIIVGLSSMGLRLHGFGVKTLGLRRYGPHLVSADSLAWSFRARSAWLHDKIVLCGGTHKGCANCYRWAHQWYDALAKGDTPR